MHDAVMYVWTIDWGDVPTWATAVATFLALRAAIYTVLLLERKREDRAEKTEEERHFCDTGSGSRPNRYASATGSGLRSSPGA